MRDYYFKIAKKISDASGIEDDEFYKLVLLIQRRATDLIRKTDTHEKSNGAKVACLLHVMRRTIPFFKIVEQINHKDIVNGMPSIDIEKAGYSESSVRRALRQLVESNILIRLETDGGRVNFYGINIPLAINVLLDLWESVTPKGATAEKQVNNLNHLKSRLKDIELFFDCLISLSDENVSAFEKNVEGLCENFKKESKSKENTQKERQAKPTPLFTGKQTGRMAIGLWNFQAKYRKEMYPNFSAVNTGKVRGMARNWIKELKDQGLDDEAISARIEKIVDVWITIRNRTFQNPITGGGRKVPEVPMFEFYYANRQVLDPMILGSMKHREYGGDKPNVLGKNKGLPNFGTQMPKKRWK